MTSYATPSELRAQIGQTTTSDNTPLQDILDAATEAIDLFCLRPDGFLAVTTATARTYTGSGGTVQVIDECAAISKVEVKDASTDSAYVEWAATDYIAGSGEPTRPNFNRLPYNLLVIDPNGDYAVFTSGLYSGHGVQTVRVTARWGYALTTPPVVKQACIAQAVRWYERAKGSMADSIGSLDFGQFFYRRALDPDIGMMLVETRLKRVAL
jgi:hypothetical protein